MRARFGSQCGVTLAVTLTFVLLGSTLVRAEEGWVVLKNCRLVPNAANDGDSFHVNAGGKEYLFRLYFADAAETDLSVPDRVEEQAEYFGVTTRQTVQLGIVAKNFAHEKLARPFTVRTCMQDAMGRSRMQRFYAFVETADGDLAELLVANGLARVHGSAATPVGLASPEREWQKLERLEREAKAERIGGWGVAAGRMATRLASQPPKSGPDSFEAFFHPEKTATTPAASSAGFQMPAATLAPAPTVPPPLSQSTTTPAARTTQAPSGGNLDVNSASSAELVKIPGIGPVLAQRIIDARPLKSADDLRTVKGIGAKKYDKIRAFFR